MNPDSEEPQIPAEFISIPTDEERRMYSALLAFFDTEISPQGFEQPNIVAFGLAGGTYRFSMSDPLQVLLGVVTESFRSERLLVIVSVAYLEDQIRTLLEKFLTDEKVSKDLLNPNDGPVSSLVPMANLAFALGLLDKEWHETLKRMANLRNRFAHIPSARSFEDLIKADAKAAGLLESLDERYKRFTRGQQQFENFSESRNYPSSPTSRSSLRNLRWLRTDYGCARFRLLPRPTGISFGHGRGEGCQAPSPRSRGRGGWGVRGAMRVKIRDSLNFAETYQDLFVLMYELIQYAIDHIVSVQPGKPFDGAQIVSIHKLIGLTKEHIQTMLG